MMRQLSIIVGVTDGCNLDCKYCYRKLDDLRIDMDKSTLDNLIKKVLEYNSIENINFIWHGGEPTLLGSSFYKRAIKLQKEYNKKANVRNLIQTNAVEIDDELMILLSENHFGIGVSLDGPRKIHDMQRVKRKSGLGSFDDVMNTIQRFHQKNIDVTSICVVTRNSLGHAREIYHFLTNEIGSVKFKPMNKIGNGLNNFNDLGITPSQYSQFLRDIFKLWAKEKREIKVFPFDSTLDAILTGIPRECSTIASCSNSFINIQPNGDMYSCADFVGNSEHYFGNINRDSFTDILGSKNRHNILNARENIEACNSCEYLPICNSGCMASAHMEYGTIKQRDYWCTAHKTVFKLIKAYIINELKMKSGGLKNDVEKIRNNTRNKNFFTK